MAKISQAFKPCVSLDLKCISQRQKESFAKHIIHLNTVEHLYSLEISAFKGPVGTLWQHRGFISQKKVVRAFALHGAGAQALGLCVGGVVLGDKRRGAGEWAEKTGPAERAFHSAPLSRKSQSAFNTVPKSPLCQHSLTHTHCHTYWFSMAAKNKGSATV